MPGVLRTRVGYCGGKMPNPDYHDLKDNTETTQIQFDSRVISYKQLLQIFWARHDYATPIDPQYKSAILYNNARQQKEALETVELVNQGKWGQDQFKGKKVLTAIEPATDFYIAEIYHQKYFLQCNQKLFNLLKYKSREELTEDPIATSLNGYLHGSGTVGAFMAEADTWPLPFAAKLAILQKITEETGLGNFKAIDEGQVENPLPGPFPVYQNGSSESGKVRTYDEVVNDFSVEFPVRVQKY